MSYRVNSNTPQLINVFESKISLALRFMLEDIHNISLPKTPKEHGNLRADVLKSVTGRRGMIAWSKNYAIYQEKKQFVHYTTPGTGPHFAENAVKYVADRSDQYWRKAGM